MYKYELVCSASVSGLNSKVRDKVKEGFRPIGAHSHQKATHEGVVEQGVWSNMFCLSMEKKDDE